MSDDSERLQQKVDELEREVAALKFGSGRRGVRKRSTKYIWGLPLYDIALGPDPDQDQVRGHARGIIAIGDIATGVLAMGGVARVYRTRWRGLGCHCARRLLNRDTPWYRRTRSRCVGHRWPRRRFGCLWRRGDWARRRWWRRFRILRVWRRRLSENM